MTGLKKTRGAAGASLEAAYCPPVLELPKRCTTPPGWHVLPEPASTSLLPYLEDDPETKLIAVDRESYFKEKYAAGIVVANAGVASLNGLYKCSGVFKGWPLFAAENATDKLRSGAIGASGGWGSL